MFADRNRLLLAFLAIMATVAIVYSNSLQNAYTFDDHPIVESNPVIQSGSWSDVLTSPFWPGQPELGLYRPVTLVSFSLNYRMIGPGPFGFHLINILLHGLACWLLSSLSADSAAPGQVWSPLWCLQRILSTPKRSMRLSGGRTFLRVCFSFLPGIPIGDQPRAGNGGFYPL